MNNLSENKLVVIHWNSRNVKNNIISVLNYIDNNEVYIRNLYFKLIDNLTDKEIKKGNLNDYYKYKSVYNLWQMSTICEKSFYKSPEITNVIKFLAIELIIEEKKPNEVHIIDAPKKVNKIIKDYCLSSKIKFKINYQNKSRFNFLKVNHFTKGLIIYFIKLLLNFNSYKQKVNYFSGKNSSFIVSYLTHLDKEKISKKLFGTGLWGDFPELLNKNGFNNNWLLVPANFKNSDNLFNVLKLSRKENKSRFNFIYSSLDIMSWLEILKDYIIIFIKSYQYDYKSIFNYKDKTNLFSLFSTDFLSSVRGAVLLENLIFINSFDKIFSYLAYQKTGFYLQENQGWELAFNSAWRKYNHGKLISVQHSTISFWDLRYHNRFKNYLNSPDFFIVNSISAKDAFISLNYNQNKVRLLEALRYSKLKKKNNSKEENCRVLILGDILKKTTTEMLNILYNVIPDYKKYEFKFKAHPAQQIKIMNKVSSIKTIDKPLVNILNNTDIVICPASSGAAVEAYYKNLKTIIYVSNGELNTSPLKNFEKVNFFTNEDELRLSLNSKNNIINENQEIFLIDENLPKWKEFLNSELNQ